MIYKSLKSYIMVVLSGLVIFATVLLVVLQWGNTGKFSLYGKNIDDANTAIIMLCSAGGGVVLVYVCRMMIRGAVTLYKSRRAAGGRRENQ